MIRRTYPPEISTICRRLAACGREVTPDQVITWAHSHAETMNRMDVPRSIGIWTAVNVIGYALMDEQCFEAMLKATLPEGGSQ